MANFNEIRDYAEERGAYNFLSRFFGGGNGMNRMFWTAFVLVAVICLFVWGLHKIVNNGSSIT